MKVEESAGHLESGRGQPSGQPKGVKELRELTDADFASVKIFCTIRSVFKEMI